MEILQKIREIEERIERIEKKMATKEDIKRVEERATMLNWRLAMLERRLELLEFNFDIFRTATIEKSPKTRTRPRNIFPKYGPEGGLDNTRAIRYVESVI